MGNKSVEKVKRKANFRSIAVVLVLTVIIASAAVLASCFCSLPVEVSIGVAPATSATCVASVVFVVSSVCAASARFSV